MVRYVHWSISTPIFLLVGRVTANGEAMAQVRDPARAAMVGDSDALAAHIDAMIVQALTDVLQGMEPSAKQLIGLRDDIASTTLVSANLKLAPHGVALLDLTITEIEILER
jgi:hypothetical protein